MEKSCLQITWCALVLSGTSILYFLALVLHLPLVVTILCVACLAAVLYRSIVKPAPDPLDGMSVTRQTLSYLIFAAGLFLLVNRGFYLSEKYGQWDAWGIWTLHAKFLQYPGHWAQILQPAVSAHPDYPLLLPGIIAFCWRILSTDSYLVPFAVSALVSLLIPSVIFLRLYRQNLLVAALVLLWFATDDFYIERSLSQYADHHLAFFFLLAFICMDAYRSSRAPVYLAITGALLASCIWIKNEGVLLAGIFVLFNIREVFFNRHVKYFFLGSALPLVAWLVFKLAYAPANDLVARQGQIEMSFLTDKSRYALIRSKLSDDLKAFFPYHWVALVAYALASVWEKRGIEKNLFIILACLAAVFVVYLLTPLDLKWHLDTSLNRLLLQLSPAFIYIVASRLALLSPVPAAWKAGS